MRNLDNNIKQEGMRESNRNKEGKKCEKKVGGRQATEKENQVNGKNNYKYKEMKKR